MAPDSSAIDRSVLLDDNRRRLLELELRSVHRHVTLVAEYAIVVQSTSLPAADVVPKALLHLDTCTCPGHVAETISSLP